MEAMAAAEGLTLATEGAGGAGSSSDSNSGYQECCGALVRACKGGGEGGGDGGGAS